VTDTFFVYGFDGRFAPLLRLAGVRPDRDGVRVYGDGRFVASFGWLRLQTTLANVTGAHITEHYRWYTAIGARLSLADDGLTFGTNRDRGVCVHFDRRVRALGPRPHSALTVTVDDCDGLVQMVLDRA
jgi:hypothetical protein